MNVCKKFFDCRKQPSRADGEKSRARLVYIALKLFAGHGYAKTSIRQIAKEAEVNVSAIAYYFGDKAGLYREILFDDSAEHAQIHSFDGEGLTLEQALSQLFLGFVEPLKQGELMCMRIRLLMREMIEPTGLWEEKIDNNIIPKHQVLLTVLQKHLKVPAIDDDLHRLARCIVAMGVHLCMGHDVINRVSPTLLADNDALDIMHTRMVMFAMSMVDAEAKRRHDEKKS